MVLWFLSLICAICKVSAQMNVPGYLSVFREDLFDAANQVMEMQNEPQESFLDFNMPRDFMHSFIPDTGVGNREDLVIDAIRSVPVFYDESFHSWRYERFNNSDYVMALHSKHLFLWKTFLTDKVPFQFSHLDSIFQYTTDGKSIVLDAVMFSRYVSHLERLYVAILSRNRRGSIISIYEIINFKGIMVTVIDLGLRTTGGVESMVGDKLAYVQSQHAGSLVVLVNSKSDHELVYQQKGSSPLSHYIEVHCQSAVDLLTFSINGHGYIAVANKTFAKVFKMNDFLQNHLTFERFPYIDEITDLEYFRLGFHHYLAIASPHNQTLYVWNSGGFFPKQEFNFPDAQQWFSALLPTCRDDIILFLMQKRSTQVFVWNGQTEQFARVIDAISSGFSPLPGSMTSFSYNTTAFVLFAQNKEDTNIFSITTHLKPVQDPVLVAGKETAMAMKQLQAMVEEQERQLKDIASVLALTVRRGGNHIFRAPQTIVDLQVTEEVSAGHLNPGNIEWTGSVLTLHQYETGSEELEKSVNQLEQYLTELEGKVQDVLLLHEDSVITGTKIISGELSALSILTSSLNMEYAAGINIKKLQTEIYRLDRPRLINGVLTMSQPMTVSGNVDVKQMVNGIDLGEEVMTTNSDQYSEASITFEGQLRVLGDLNLSGKLGNIEVDTEMVTLTREHFIPGTKSFTNGLIAGNVEATLVDGVDIVNMNARAFKTSESQVVTGLFSLHRPLYTQNIHLKGKINGYDIAQLSGSLIRVDQTGEIMGTKTFLENVHVKEAVNVRGLFDGLTVPKDFLTPNQSSVITGKKVFEAKMVTNDVTVYGKVDGINFPSDIITLTTDQILNGKFYFVNGIMVQNDIAVNGLVDGIDVSKLTETSLKLNNTNEIQEVIFLGPLTVLGNVDVGGYVNGQSLEELIKDMVFKDDQNVLITGPKHFKNVTAGLVRANHMVNDYNLETEFMKSDGVQEIYGTKVFKNPVTFRNIFVENGQIDGVNVQELYNNRITLSLKNQTSDKIEFDTLSIDGNMTIHGTIDGINFPHDVVLKTTNQTIEDKIFLTDSYIHRMRVHGDASVSGSFADISLSNFATERVTLSQEENINGSLILRDTVASKVTIHRFENGLDIKEFSENIMSLTKDQIVYSSKEFSGLVSVYGNIASNGINGILLEKVKEYAFKLNEPNIVSSNFVFTNSLSSENLKVDGLVNGINLTDLFFDTVKQEGELQVIFTKDNKFHSGFHVEGNIHASMVNEMILQDDILTKTTPQTVKGKYSFLPSVTIMGEMRIHGHINELDLSEINKLLAKTDRSNVVKSDLVFTKPVNISKNMDVVGLFNEVDLNIFENNSLSEVGLIAGHKTLIGNVTVYGNINATFINGVNWLEFLSDVVRLDIPQNVQSLKIFSSDIDVRGDIYVTDHALVGYINSIDLKQFQDDAVFINQAANITGVKIFSNAIETSGDLIAEFINGLNLKRDVIILQCTDEGIQHIKGSKTFKSVTVMGDIHVEKSVNGYKLKDLFEDTWTSDGGQEVLGHKAFLNLVTFEKNVNVKTVNGMFISRDLVTLDTKQEIDGALELMKNAEIVGNLDVSGPVNGVDLRRLAEVSLYVDTNQTVEGSLYISKAIVKSDLVLRGLINNLDLEEFKAAVEDFYDESYRKNQNWNETMLQHCKDTKALISVLESSYNVLDEFVPLQDMNYLADIIEVNEVSGELHLFRIRKHGSSASVFSYKYDSKQNMFMPSGRSTESVVQKKIYRANNQNLVISFSGKGIGFGVKIGGIQVPNVHWGFRDAAALFVDGKFLVAVLYPTLESCEILSLSDLPYNNVKPEIMGKIVVGKEAKAVTLFKASGDLYVAISCKYDDPTLKGASLIYSWVDKEWQLVQRIQTPSSSHVIHFKYHQDDFLAFSDVTSPSDSHEPMAAKVYRYSNDNGHPFKLFQKVSFDNVLGMDVFEFGGLKDLYLTLFNQTVLQIFRLEGESGFISVFTLHADCITSSKPVVLNGQLFLIISQKNKFGRHPVTLVYKGVTQGPNPSRKMLAYCP